MKTPITFVDPRYRHTSYEEHCEAIERVEKEIERLLNVPFDKDRAGRLIMAREALTVLKCCIVDARKVRARLRAMVEAKKAQMGLFEPGEPVGKSNWAVPEGVSFGLDDLEWLEAEAKKSDNKKPGSSWPPIS